MGQFPRAQAPDLSRSLAFALAFAVGACGPSAAPIDSRGTGGGSATGGQAASPGGAGGSVTMSAGNTSGGATGVPSGGASAAGAAVGGSTLGGTTSGGTGNGGNSGNSGNSGNAGTAGHDPNKRKLLLRDEGNSAVHYVDLADARNNWHQAVPLGRDLQVIGGQRFLIGTDNGFQERNLSDGGLVNNVTAYPGTLAAHRLHNGNTLLTGVDFHGGKGIVLVEITPQGSVGRQIEYPGTYARMVREVGADHFLVTADARVFEGDAQGNVVWDVTVQGGPAAPHAWEALRLASGDTLVSAGYAARLEIFGADKQLKQTITGGDGVKPNFFADVQVMPGGSYVVANWQGHGLSLGANGLQVVEYDAAGKLIWSWKQDASFVSSLQQVLVLDGLDLDKLHVESPQTGVLQPAK